MLAEAQLRDIALPRGCRGHARSPCGCGVMSNSKHASRALTHNSIVLFLDDVQLEFTSIFDTAPNLDLNAIPAGYQIIGMSARVEAAHANAPLKSQNEVKTVHERRVQRLSVFYERASELSHIHAKLAADMMLTNKVLQLLTLGATTGISFLVKTWAGNEDLLMVSGIVVTIVGGINSWTKYADYLAKVRFSPIHPLLAMLAQCHQSPPSLRRHSAIRLRRTASIPSRPQSRVRSRASPRRQGRCCTRRWRISTR